MVLAKSTLTKAYNDLLSGFDLLDTSYSALAPQKKKIECWRYFGCDSYGSCDAYKMKSGKKCWLVSGTLSGKETPQCWVLPKGDQMLRPENHTVQLSIKSCKECLYYKYMKEGTDKEQKRLWS